MIARSLLSLLLTLAFCIAASATEQRLLTPQDLWAIKRVTSPALSPDGRHAVFRVQEWSIEKNESTSNLWTVPVAGGEVRRLTTAETSEDAPVWSPDGTRIAFTSKRGKDENASLYVIPFHGGEAQKILELPNPIGTPRWLPEGKSIVVATSAIPELAGKWAEADVAAMKKELKRRKESKMTAKVTENRQYRHFDRYLTDNLANRLLRVDLATKAITDLTPGVDRLFLNSGDIHYDIAPDGKTIALEFNTTAPPFRDYPNADIYLIPTDGSGTMKNVTPENKGDDGPPLFSPDGRSVYFKRQETPYYSGESEKLWRHDLAAGRNTPVTEPIDYSIGDVRVSGDSRTLWITAEEKGVMPIFRLNADGTEMKPVYTEGTSTGLEVRGDAIVFLNDTMNRPNELFALDPKTGAARQLTRFNDEFMAGIKLGKVEPYWFKGANDADVHGWLVLPPNYDPAKKYPLVQLLHGGPHTMNRDSWSYRWNTQVFAAAGWIVTWVNRHGSTGFGEEFARSILNQWGDKPLEDVMKSTDALLQRFPNIDGDRLAAAGASYGGYMAAWILGHTDRFKALVNHAGVNNSYSQFASDMTHSFMHVMGGSPWGDVEGLQRNNPMFYAKNFRTPTLVIHGELDYRVPYGNALELYAALQAQEVPSRLVIFPDENHWILKPQNAIHWHWEMQSWLARYIGGTPTLEKPNFETKDETKPGDPKAGATKPTDASE
ncbi:MAG: S9 family peptidase [Chthoniobacterales bacterium]|nr:S9 family peptidase [Chthoniobacterales bacterium]